MSDDEGRRLLTNLGLMEAPSSRVDASELTWDEPACDVCGAEPVLRECAGCSRKGYIGGCCDPYPPTIGPHGIYGSQDSCEECECDAAGLLMATMTGKPGIA
mgnify:CR=1 FL=1